MTGQPPEGSERIYTGQYGDPFVEYEQAPQQGTHDPYGSYGEQRYREDPVDYTLPGGPVSYDSTAYEFPSVPSDAPPQPAYQPGTGPGTGPQQAYHPGTGPQPGVGSHSGTGPHHTGPHKMGRPRPDGRPRATATLRSALSDFEFAAFSTPRIVPILYKLSVAVSALVAVGIVVGTFEANLILGVVGLLILAPAVFVLGVGLSRLFMEFCLIAFRMSGAPENTRNTTEGN
jgi:hypothetical protein